MGNPSIKLPPRDQVPAPPVAAPARPGEKRDCLSCVRCTDVIQSRSTLAVDCAWQGRWDWPYMGCDRWALNPEPIACLLPGNEPKPLVWQGKATSRRRRR